MKRYLDEEDIHNSLQKSFIEKKVVVIPDNCGTGKTEASLDFVIKYFIDGILVVVEKIVTINHLKKELLRRGIPENDIGVYHHESEENINEVYENKGSKLVSLVTHVRLLLDPCIYG